MKISSYFCMSANTFKMLYANNIFCEIFYNLNKIGIHDEEN